MNELLEALGLGPDSLALLHDFLQQHGYLLLFLGVLAEGEAILALAGALAHAGHMDLIKVILTAWVASSIVEQGLFLVGHHYGPRLLERFPRLQRNAPKARQVIARYGDLAAVLFRFMYGVRTVAVLLLGSQGYPRLRFAIINLPASLLWSAVIAGLGYLFSASLKLLLSRIQHAEILLLGLLILGVTAFLLLRIRQKA
ncbi:DedA family protein [Thermithiobacillus plumbiphilus]|uniref:DedA family protein n=1 Tax=Thermithiobacillus plumbiphilus TaxID=1729899 RepID=A0ABU9DC15_9PROT